MVSRYIGAGKDIVGEVNDTRQAADLNLISSAVIGAAIEVHRVLGPGLLESAYEECLCKELTIRHVPFERQRFLPVEYKGIQVDCGYRLDFLVRELVIVELKAVDVLLPIHEAQLMTYLKLGGWHLGLLINFNVDVLKHGIKRRVWGVSLASSRKSVQEIG